MTRHPCRRLTAILSIAGSDPSGGAGIQADLKTCTVLGAYGAAVVTSLTAQNTRGISLIRHLEPEFVEEQIRLVLEDLSISHIKIGMVGNGAVAAAVAAALENFAGEIVYDPVLDATSGASLHGEEDIRQVVAPLLGRATVITPNLPELEAISGNECRRDADMRKNADLLFENRPRLRTIIVKGGHFPGPRKEIIDHLFIRGGDTVAVHTESHPYLETANTHGTGCTFAAAFTAFHQKFGDDIEAFRRTAFFMDQLMTLSADCYVGQGTGPLIHFLMQ